MRIERQIEYEVKDDAEAIQIAKERLGADAVIISSRHVKRGGFLGFFRRDVILVTAGLFEEDPQEQAKESRERMVAFQHLLDARRAIHGLVDPVNDVYRVSENTPPLGVSPPPVETYQPILPPPPKPLLISAPQSEGVLRKEVDEIRETLLKVMNRLDEGVVSSAPLIPVEDIDLEVVPLLRGDVDRQTALEISEEYRKMGKEMPFRDWLANQIPVMGSNSSESLGGKRVLFVGPTGVGKTTTIAKLAAMQSLWEGKRVVLITADTYRIAAVEQLRTYAKILGIPIEIIFSHEEVKAAMKKHSEADLFLLDTAGRSHQDGKRMDELRELYEAFSPDAVHLVLASNIKYRDMLDVVDRMGIIPLSALLFTKLDETSTYGPILNILRDFDLPVSFFTVGQNVPNDIEVARGDRLADFLLGVKPIEGR